jgi:RNA polymerase sigma factor (sigma-70 family)
MLKLVGKPGGAAAGERPSPPAASGDDLAPLVRRARGGERDAQRTLLTIVGPLMLQMVRRVLGSGNSDVEDVFQEAAMGLLRSLPGFRGDCGTRHFACRVATLTALKARRRQANEPTAALADTDDEPAEAVDDRDWAMSAHRRDMLRRLLDELPDAQAEALVLHCVAGLTIDELAGATRTPVETARSRLRLAKAALRERIALDPTLTELLEDS